VRKLIIAAGRDVRGAGDQAGPTGCTTCARSSPVAAQSQGAHREGHRASAGATCCDRLGIQILKRELEDCVLKALSPSGYALIAEYLTQRRGWAEYLERAIAAFSHELRVGRVDCKVTSRPRHLYSIWKDTVAGRYSEPHDLPGSWSSSTAPTWTATRPRRHPRQVATVPGRFKDFIASPKNNLYRSLHTTVIGPDGPLRGGADPHRRHAPQAPSTASPSTSGTRSRCRIRHRDRPRGPRRAARMAAAPARLGEAPPRGPGQFLASLRCDLSESQIIVFTSSGRPVLLPTDATPVDLAYTLSADTGHRFIGSRINGRLVPLSSPLADGDSVEIITRRGSR
jgi:GTP pyrophosphokinase